MAAYLVARGRIHDEERFGRYLEGVVATLEPYSAKLLGLEDPAEVLEAMRPKTVCPLNLTPCGDFLHVSRNLPYSTICSAVKRPVALWHNASTGF